MKPTKCCSFLARALKSPAVDAKERRRDRRRGEKGRDEKISEEEKKKIQSISLSLKSAGRL